MLFCLSLGQPVDVQAMGKQKVYVIPVSGVVDPAMAAFFERTLTEHAQDPSALVVIEMDTFGGLVTSAIAEVDGSGPAVVHARIDNGKAWAVEYPDLRGHQCLIRSGFEGRRHVLYR